MAALQYVDNPKYAALILRKTYAELSLPGALLDRSREWLTGTGAVWSTQEKTWRFPSGATLSFGYLETDADVYRYQSAEFQFIGVDEITEFAEKPVLFLFSRLRRLEGSDIPLRMRSASNPGGVGHDWVKRRYIDEGLAHGRIYIPAGLDDNPHLDRAGYVDSLNRLDPITRARLLAGDWSVRDAGGLFRREWFKVLDVRPAGYTWVRYWDLAATAEGHGTDPDWTVGALVGRSPEGRFCVADIRRIRGSPQAVESLVKQTAAIDGAAIKIYIEQEPGAGGKTLLDYYTRQLAGYIIRPDKPASDKVTRSQPLSSQAEAGNVDIVNGPWVGDFLDEMEAFPAAAHDDQVDATSGAFGQLVIPGSYSNWAEAAQRMIDQRTQK